MLIFASGLYFVSMKFIMLAAASKLQKSERTQANSLKLKKKNTFFVCALAIKTEGENMRE